MGPRTPYPRGSAHKCAESIFIWLFRSCDKFPPIVAEGFFAVFVSAKPKVSFLSVDSYGKATTYRAFIDFLRLALVVVKGKTAAAAEPECAKLAS